MSGFMRDRLGNKIVPGDHLVWGDDPKTPEWEYKYVTRIDPDYINIGDPENSKQLTREEFQSSKWKLKPDGEMRSLHIYGQEFWHCNATIVGTRAALERLHQQLGNALAGIESTPDDYFYVNDGEGYKVIVLEVSEEDFQRLPEPYVDSPVPEERQERWEFLRKLIGRVK